MTIKQQGGVFGRNPTFNTVTVDDKLGIGSEADVALKVSNGLSGYTWVPNARTTAIIESDFANGTTLSIVGKTGTSSNIWLADSDAENVGMIRQNHTGNVMSFGSAQAFTVDLDGSGNLKLLTGNLVIATSGKGIDFSATAGTGTSELFNDYEEGTWTPVPADAETGGNTGTAGTATGYYTKVGNVVHVMGALVNVSTSGLTAGNLFYIQGLPFASKDLAGATAYYLSGGALTSSVSITGNVQFYLNDLSKTSVTFFDAGGSILVSDLTSGAADFYFSLTYMAA